MQRRRGARYSLAMASGLVVCGSSCRRIGVLARSSVAFLRYPRDGCASVDLVRVRDRKGLGLAQYLPLVHGFICVRLTGVRVVLCSGTSCASALIVTPFENTCISRACTCYVGSGRGWGRCSPLPTAVQSCSPPYRPVGRRSENRPAARPNRARTFRRHQAALSAGSGGRPDLVPAFLAPEDQPHTGGGSDAQRHRWAAWGLRRVRSTLLNLHFWVTSAQKFPTRGSDPPLQMRIFFMVSIFFSVSVFFKKS